MPCPSPLKVSSVSLPFKVPQGFCEGGFREVADDAERFFQLATFLYGSVELVVPIVTCHNDNEVCPLNRRPDSAKEAFARPISVKEQGNKLVTIGEPLKGLLARGVSPDDGDLGFAGAGGDPFQVFPLPQKPLRLGMPSVPFFPQSFVFILQSLFLFRQSFVFVPQLPLLFQHLVEQLFQFCDGLAEVSVLLPQPLNFMGLLLELVEDVLRD